MFVVCVMCPELLTWVKLGRYRREVEARVHYHDLRAAGEYTWVALAWVSGLVVRVLDSDCPIRPGDLGLTESFAMVARR